MKVVDNKGNEIDTQRAERAKILRREPETIINSRYWDNETKIQS